MAPDFSSYAFDSSDVAKIVGITPIYLNALVHRKLYGIVPSISDRHGEMKIRIFGAEDLFGIGLVWTLFESGLRTNAIREVLVQLAGTDEPDANVAAEYLTESGYPAYLVIVRELTTQAKKRKLKVSVEATLSDTVLNAVAEGVDRHPTANILIVPVGARFAEIAERMQQKYGE
jgi:hypothetical protein